MTLSEELLQKMRTFVRDEAVAQRARFQQFWDLPLAERVQEGRCLADLVYVGVEAGKLKLQCQSENGSDFREGDLVRVSLGEPNFYLSTGSIFRVEDHFIWLQAESNPFTENPVGPWVLDYSYLDLSKLLFEALDEAARSTRGREKVLPLLTGELASAVDAQKFADAEDAVPGEKTNDSQKEAVAQGVATTLYHLIQGPPGTGKTHTLAEIVRQRVDAGERILVTGPTHRAIHHALNQIRGVVPETVPIVKIGRPIHDPELQVPQYENFADSGLENVADAYVIGATPFTARGRLGRVEFDAVVVDEASQITLPLAVMAMLSAKHYIFVGDHRQLPPVVQSATPLEAAQASIFHHLSGRGNTSLLNQTFRMNETLTRWPSESFYNGQLKAAPTNARRRLALPQALQDFTEVLDPAHPLVLVEMTHENTRRYSNEEATTVVGLLVHLHLSGVNLKDVAVVVPFRRQARRIRSFLEKRSELRLSDWQHCVVDTVERMQGQEREVVLISMTASEPEYLQQMAEFLLLPQRLNVAVTRARSKVILLASHRLCKIPSASPEVGELVELWKTLRQHCHRVAL